MKKRKCLIHANIFLPNLLFFPLSFPLTFCPPHGKSEADLRIKCDSMSYVYRTEHVGSTECVLHAHRPELFSDTPTACFPATRCFRRGSLSQLPWLLSLFAFPQLSRSHVFSLECPQFLSQEAPQLNI